MIILVHIIADLRITADLRAWQRVPSARRLQMLSGDNPAVAPNPSPLSASDSSPTAGASANPPAAKASAKAKKNAAKLAQLDTVFTPPKGFSLPSQVPSQGLPAAGRPAAGSIEMQHIGGPNAPSASPQPEGRARIRLNSAGGLSNASFDAAIGKSMSEPRIAYVVQD